MILIQGLGSTHLVTQGYGYAPLASGAAVVPIRAFFGVRRLSSTMAASPASGSSFGVRVPRLEKNL